MKKKLSFSASTAAGNCLLSRRSFSYVLFILLLSIAPRFCAAQTVLLNESFGTGTTLPTGWTASGTNWLNSTSNASSGYTGASGGSSAEFMNDNTTAQTLTYSNNLSTVGFTNISVLWGSRIVYSFLGTTTITVTLSWSADGTTWNNVTYTNNTSTTWGLVNGGTRIALPAGAAGQTNLRLRLTASAAGAANIFGSTSYKVDDFMVDGCPTSAGTISYLGSPFCTSIATAQPVTSTGITGGTYSSTTGLTINTSTGAITPSTSTAGTYTVTYTIAASGGCVAVSTTTTVTITAAPSATISYTGSPFCTTSGVVTVTRTGTAGGTYSSTAGLTINASTGAITPTSSTAGNYTITYTIAASGGCTVFTTTTNVTITAAPSATISYIGNPFCSNAGTASVTRSGTAGGIYSSTTGLIIDVNTGAVNTGTSTAGTYTITYTIASSGGCAQFSTTTSITITTAPSPTISYSGSPFCISSGLVSVTRTGTAGGTYSSTTGLTINTTTGAITPSTSTAGTYTITYTIAAGGGCALYTTTTSITISAAPSASISYSGNPFCSNSAVVNVTRIGTAGGSYSSSTGLVINASTGAITPATSTAGTYTITYAITASGGCSAYTTTTSVTITAAPSATISYAGSPYCANAGTATVSRTGTIGGTYSSSAGLSIDANTGNITLASSTAGTYTVTYTIAASGGCATYTTTASITINAMPSASISYSGNPFCSNNGVINVTRTGSAGGTYTSTTGLIIDTNTGAVNTGTSTAGTYTVTYTISANGGCSVFTTTTSITIQTAGIWTGAASTDYNNTQNWLCGGVPTATTNIMVSTGLTNYPIVTGVNAANNISIASSASLTVNGGTFQIAGTITNNGKFSSVNGTTEFAGSVAQQIPAGLFDSSYVKNLTINNNAGVTLAATLNLTGILSITAGQFNTGDLLILKSTATGTAMVGNITSAATTPVNGKVTIERYIPGRRKYRLITSSVTTSSATTLTAGQENLSIWGAWQNSGNNTIANTGTIITGGSNADGFDTQTTNASLFTYDDVNRRYIGYTTTNGKNTKYTPLKAGVAYYIFVYGDRTNTITTSSPNNTTLRTTGTLLTGTQSYTTNSAMPLTGVTGRFTFLGNPFAAAINWATIPKTNLENTYWGWDPNLSSTGGYVTVLTNGSVVLQAPFSGTTGLNQYIQPGQGFFVRTSGASPTLTIREQDKVTNFNSNAFRVTGTADQLSLMAVNLQYPNGSSKVLADGVLAAFDAAFSNSVNEEDAAKLPNTTESIAVVNDTNSLSIDARLTPQNGDTIFLNIARLTKPQYTLQIFTQQMNGSNLQAYLQDRYLNTLQLLSFADTNNITFTTNLTIPASIDANRFRILFRSAPILLPLHFVAVKAAVINKDVQVDWTIAEEADIKKYEVERSTDGITFSKVAELVPAKLHAVENYSWIDKNPAAGNNYYRIRAVQMDGNSISSKVVSVKLIGDANISISPNPVTAQQITIHCNDLDKGKYLVQLINPQGQQVLSITINHPGGLLHQPVYFDKQIASGAYYFELKNENRKYNQMVFVK